jgi:hypothetical protein
MCSLAAKSTVQVVLVSGEVYACLHSHVQCACTACMGRNALYICEGVYDTGNDGVQFVMHRIGQAGKQGGHRQLS